MSFIESVAQIFCQCLSTNKKVHPEEDSNTNGQQPVITMAPNLQIPMLGPQITIDGDIDTKGLKKFPLYRKVYQIFNKKEGKIYEFKRGVKRIAHRTLVILRIRKKPKMTLKRLVTLQRSASAFSRRPKEKITFRKLARLSLVTSILKQKKKQIRLGLRKFCFIDRRLRAWRKESIAKSQLALQTRQEEMRILRERIEKMDILYKKVTFRTISKVLGSFLRLEKKHLKPRPKLTLKKLARLNRIIGIWAEYKKSMEDNVLLQGPSGTEVNGDSKDNVNQTNPNFSGPSSILKSRASLVMTNLMAAKVMQKDDDVIAELDGESEQNKNEDASNPLMKNERFRKLICLHRALIKWQKAVYESLPRRKKLEQEKSIIEQIRADTLAIKEKTQTELDQLMPDCKEAWARTEVPWCPIDLMKSIRFCPPRPVQLVMAAICILKGISPDIVIQGGTKEIVAVDYWTPSQKLLVGSFHDELNLLRDPNYLLAANIREYQDRIVQNPEFNRNDIERAFPPAAIMYDFILNLEHYGMLLEPIREKQDIIFVANLMLKKCKSTIKHIKRELKQLQKNSRRPSQMPKQFDRTESRIFDDTPTPTDFKNSTFDRTDSKIFEKASDNPRKLTLDRTDSRFFESERKKPLDKSDSRVFENNSILDRSDSRIFEKSSENMGRKKTLDRTETKFEITGERKKTLDRMDSRISEILVNQERKKTLDRTDSRIFEKKSLDQSDSRISEINQERRKTIDRNDSNNKVFESKIFDLSGNQEQILEESDSRIFDTPSPALS